MEDDEYKICDGGYRAQDIGWKMMEDEEHRMKGMGVRWRMKNTGHKTQDREGAGRRM